MLLLPEQQRVLTSKMLTRLAWVQLAVLFPFVYLIPGIASWLIIAPSFWVISRHYFHKSIVLPRWFIIILTLSMATAVFFTYGTLRGKDAGVALIVVMYGLKILEARKYRDLNLLLTLGFFILSMSFLFSQSFIFIVYLIFVFGFIVHSLMLANSQEKILFNWVSCAKLLGVSLPLMIFLFLFFPRLPGPLWKMPDQRSAGSGISDSMTPGDIGALNLNDDPAFRVKFSGGQNPKRKELYWRGLVFEDYDGVTWRGSSRRIKSPLNYDSNAEQTYQYAITLEPTRQKWLFALDIPIGVENKVSIQSDATFTARFKIEQRIRYQATSAMDFILEPSLDPAIRLINTEIPDGYNPRSKAWAIEQYSLINDPQAFVEYLLKYINKEPYFYTLSPPVMLDDMVDDFWFIQRTGFCEHYAGAFVFMLRAANIPARVVTGYQGGEYNTLGDYFLIMQRDAHAWTEYWVEEKGWVRIDPTSAIAPFRIDSSLLNEMNLRGFLFDQIPGAENFDPSWFGYARQWMDNANSFWREWVIDFSQQNQTNLFNFLKLGKLNSRVLYLILLTGVFGFLVFIAWYLMRIGKPLDDVARSYAIILKKLEAKNYFKRPDEGAKDFLLRVILAQPNWKNDLRPILSDYLVLRYSARSVSEAELRNFKRRVRAFHPK